MFTLSNSDSTSVGTAWALRMLCFCRGLIGLHLAVFFFCFLQEMHESKGKESMGKFDMGQWADTNEDTPI